MYFLRIYKFSCSSNFLALILIFPLISCSSGGGGGGGGGDAGSAVILNWVAPSEREDNSGLSLSEIAGYRIYYSAESGGYQSQNKLDVNDGSVTQAQISGLLPSGTYYIAVTTVDTEGRESLFSTEVVISL